MLFFRWLLAILILPGTVLIAIPSLFLWLDHKNWLDCLLQASGLKLCGVAILGFLGIALALWTNSLFFRFGKGTAAPWDPPKRFIARGPYLYVRNPMIIGVILILSAEALLANSWLISAWLCVGVLANLIYIPVVEEKSLSRRFGADYDVFRRNVPRWFPRFTAWKPEKRKPNDG